VQKKFDKNPTLQDRVLNDTCSLIVTDNCHLLQKPLNDILGFKNETAVVITTPPNETDRDIYWQDTTRRLIKVQLCTTNFFFFGEGRAGKRLMHK